MIATVWYFLFGYFLLTLPTDAATCYKEECSAVRTRPIGWKDPALHYDDGTVTYVVIVSTSRYWFNYRHSANALAVYSVVRRMGVSDSNIILMLADDHACAGRNARAGAMSHGDGNMREDLYPDDIEVDYSGADVTPDALLRIITGRHLPGTHRRKTLGGGRDGGIGANSRATLLLYMTGHGGDGFLKFHDKDELTSSDLAAALEAGQATRRFGEVLAIFDTCQASSLIESYTRRVPNPECALQLGRTWLQHAATRLLSAAARVGCAFGLKLRDASASDNAHNGNDACIASSTQDAWVDCQEWNNCSNRGLISWTRLSTRAGASVNLIAMHSSERGQNSYAYGHDDVLAMSSSDGFTRWGTEFMHSVLHPPLTLRNAPDGIAKSAVIAYDALLKKALDCARPSIYPSHALKQNLSEDRLFVRDFNDRIAAGSPAGSDCDLLSRRCPAHGASSAKRSTIIERARLPQRLSRMSFVTGAEVDDALARYCVRIKRQRRTGQLHGGHAMPTLTTQYLAAWSMSESSRQLHDDAVRSSVIGSRAFYGGDSIPWHDAATVGGLLKAVPYWRISSTAGAQVYAAAEAMPHGANLSNASLVFLDRVPLFQYFGSRAEIA